MAVSHKSVFISAGICGKNWTDRERKAGRKSNSGKVNLIIDKVHKVKCHYFLNQVHFHVELTTNLFRVKST